MFYLPSHIDLFCLSIKVSFKLGVLGQPPQKLYPTWSGAECWSEIEGVPLGAEMKQGRRKVLFCSQGPWYLSPGCVWARGGRNVLGIRRGKDGRDPPSQGISPDCEIRDSSGMQSTTPVTSLLTRRRSGQKCCLSWRKYSHPFQSEELS